MSYNAIQHSFSGGELAPGLFARTDLPKYKAGAATMRNYYADYRGGAISRAGTQFVAAVRVDGAPVRLIPFAFNDTQNYVLEFGHQYMRVIIDGGLVLHLGSPYVLVTPWAAADLALLKFTQSADTMTFTHPSYQPYDLVRVAEDNWTLTAITFAASQAAPTGGTAAATHGTEAAASGDATTTTYRYVVTAISSTTGEESLASASFENPADSRIMSSDGNAYVTLGWVAAAGAATYNVYRQQEVPNAAPVSGSIYGLIGTTSDVSFQDRDSAPVFTQTPPANTNPFAGSNYPGCVCYFQQRKTFGGSTSKPATFYMTQTGLYQNMNLSTPVKDSDAITATINAQQVNAIKALVPTESSLIALTAGGAFSISGASADAAVTPASIKARPQASDGANDVPPLKIGYELLFIQANGARVRDLSYDFYKNIYTGQDITVMSSHLFNGRTVKEWAWAVEPGKVVWAVRDDGILLSLTYLKEQEVYGWARHDTQGLFQSVAAIREGEETAVYFVVKRFVGGTYVQYIERMASRALGANSALNVPAQPDQAWCVDCGLSLDQPTPAATLLPGGASGDGVSCITDAAVFDISYVGRVIRGNGGIATITAYLSPTAIQVSFSKAMTALIPNDPSGLPVPIPAGQWTCTTPVTSLGGLSHLNGKTVSILADGAVMSPRVVAGGAITLDHAASSVVVGLPYECELTTLRLDLGEGGQTGTIQGKRKQLNAVTIRVQDTGGGLLVGSEADAQVPVKVRTPLMIMGTPIPLADDDIYINTDPSWDINGQLFFSCSEPVPTSILGVICEPAIGDT